MVQLFQRYVPYRSLLDFAIQSLLGMTAFTLVVQAAWYLRLDPTLPALPGLRIGRALLAVSVVVLVFYLTGYFERRRHLTTSMYVPRLIQAIPLGGITLAVLYQVAPSVALGWPVAGSALGVMGGLMLAWHVAAPRLVREESLSDNVLVLGDGPLAAQIADHVLGARTWGFHLVGYVPIAEAGSYETSPILDDVGGDTPPSRNAESSAASDPTAHARILPFPTPRAMPTLSVGRLADLEAILQHHGVHTLVVALADRRGRLPLATLMAAKLRGVQVFDAIDFYERLTGRMLVARMRPSAIIFADGFTPGRATMLAKRLLDVSAAIVALALTAPLQAAIALAIATTSRGPAIFRQERIGLNGMPFTIYKFRTMRVDAEHNGPQWASQNDDRITGFGRFLRKSRLDELPQLWNILRGHMSFVGPRPEQPAFVRTLRSSIPYYDQRHAVRPGLTGWAQVKYPYGATIEETEEKLEFDLYYIKHLSFTFDLTIMFETVRVLLTGKGAR